MAKSSLKTADKRKKDVDGKKYNILNADSDNKYYQRMEDIMLSSNTGVSCFNTFVRFVFGEGLLNKDFGASIVNRKGLTVDGLAAKMIDSRGKFTGIAVHVNYNGLGDIISVTPVEFSYCRIGIEEEAGKIAVYNDWDYSKNKNIKTSEIKYYDRFAPHKVLREVNSIELTEDEIKSLSEEEQEVRKWKKYKGQILWWSPVDSYPLVPFDSVAEDMQTEGNVKNTKRTASASNFMPSHIMERPAFEDTKAGNQEREDWHEHLGEFQGDEGVGSILEVEIDSPESGLKLHKIDIQNYDGIQKYTEESVKENIRENRLIPQSLLTKGGSTFSGDDIESSVELYNSTTSADRKIIQDILIRIFKYWHTDINPSNEYRLSPLKAFDPLRKFASEITATLSNNALSQSQKMLMLINSYEIGEELAKELTKVEPPKENDNV
jgi:hypothetical protein